MKPLNLFYEEPEPDRWLPYDRYARRLVRRVVRGKPRPGGHKRVFLNLCAGLQRIGVPFRVNDYRYIANHTEEVAGIIGKPHLLDEYEWRNPILFGAAGYSHPIDDSRLLERLPIRKILVPGEWMREMCEPFWGDKVATWAVGIDTERWKPNTSKKDFDLLIYDKVRWKHNYYEGALINPIIESLKGCNLKYTVLRYGFYKEREFHQLLARSRAMVFLCEHETQGIAYQQALSCDVPLLAWDRGGFWQDAHYYPHQVKFEAVSSVPYWDARCGEKFKDAADFQTRLGDFLHLLEAGKFAPRSFIIDNLTLEKCARKYVEFYQEVQGNGKFNSRASLIK